MTPFTTWEALQARIDAMTHVTLEDVNHVEIWGQQTVIYWCLDLLADIDETTEHWACCRYIVLVGDAQGPHQISTAEVSGHNAVRDAQAAFDEDFAQQPSREQLKALMGTLQALAVPLHAWTFSPTLCAILWSDTERLLRAMRHHWATFQAHQPVRVKHAARAAYREEMTTGALRWFRGVSNISRVWRGLMPLTEREVHKHNNTLHRSRWITGGMISPANRLNLPSKRRAERVMIIAEVAPDVVESIPEHISTTSPVARWGLRICIMGRPGDPGSISWSTLAEFGELHCLPHDQLEPALLALTRWIQVAHRDLTHTGADGFDVLVRALHDWAGGRDAHDSPMTNVPQGKLWARDLWSAKDAREAAVDPGAKAQRTRANLRHVGAVRKLTRWVPCDRWRAVAETEAVAVATDSESPGSSEEPSPDSLVCAPSLAPGLDQTPLG